VKEKGPFNFGWIIVGISFITLALADGVWYSFSVFFVALLEEFRWSRSTAAGAFSLFVIVHSLIGPFAGDMVDRFGPRRVILLGSLFFGMGYAATAALPPVITADFFEGEAYGGIFGALMLLNGVGGASGAWPAGFFYDQVGTYVPVFIIMIACALFACLNIWRAAPRKIRNVPGKRRTLHPSA
jgi:MFS family permease